MTSADQPLEHLTDPPIEEVVCGLLFPQVDGLDAVAAGAYWQERRPDYPRKELHPPILRPQQGGVVRLGRIVMQRAWLISAAEDFLIQVQGDGFYLNWRRRAAEYPRFNDHGGTQGVLTRLIGEFDRFSEFCQQTLGHRPQPAQATLAKIDHLVQGRHWKDLPDLVRVLPALGAVAQFASTSAPGLALRFVETREDGAELNIQIDTATRTGPDRSAVDILKIEGSAVLPLTPGRGLRPAFIEMNDQLNRVFGRLLTREVRNRLFASPGVAK